MGKFICDFCGKEYTRAGSGKNYKKHFCSNECRYKARREKDVIYYEEDYAYILLTKDNTTKKVLFDVEDIEKIKQYKWHLHYRKKGQRYDVCTNRYGCHNRKGRYLLLARFLTDCPVGLTVDHINRITLDNRKSNLRVCTQYINNLNKNTNTSGCIGVSWDKNRNKWHVMFKDKNLGRFVSFDEAVAVRKQAERDYFLSHPQNF